MSVFAPGGSRGRISSAAVAAAIVSLCLLPSSVAAAEAQEHAPDSGDSRIVAFCSIPPQSYLVERVGGDHVSVHVMVGQGQSPHSFEPTPKQMAALADARVYFAIGLPFEDRILSGIEKLSAGLVVVDTSDGIPRRVVEGSHHHDDHNAEKHRDGGLPDPHVWLNPRNASDIARSICTALKRVAPEHEGSFDSNLAALLHDLTELDEELSAALAPLEGESVYVFHPAFGYFTDAYGLKQVPVEVGGMEPSAREMVELMKRAGEDGVRVIFVQPQFSSRSAKAIASEIGGVVVPIDPLSSSYLENLRSLAGEIRRALGGEAPRVEVER